MGPMVKFIAQMVEYNETLTVYRTFIEQNRFFFDFFLDPGDLRDHPEGTGGCLGPKSQCKTRFKGVLRKNDAKTSKIIFNHTFMD